MAQTLLIDYAWAHPDPAAIKAAGYVGVMRYLSRDASKSITPDEVKALQAQGLAIGLVFEDTAQRALGGTGAGLIDGLFANQAADALGFPKDLPIFYAVDFDVSTAQLSATLAYVRSAATAGRQAHGYGSAAFVHALEAAGIPDNWQTVAWSNGEVDAKAALYQRLRPTTSLQGSFDEDVLLNPVHVLWYPASAQPADPTPPTQPQAIPGKDIDMLLIKSASKPDIYLVLGDGSVHVPTTADVELLEKAGVASAQGLSDALVNSIVGLS